MISKKVYRNRKGLSGEERAYRDRGETMSSKEEAYWERARIRDEKHGKTLTGIMLTMIVLIFVAKSVLSPSQLYGGEIWPPLKW